MVKSNSSYLHKLFGRFQSEVESELDIVGMVLSVLCLAHCLVLPFVMLSLPFIARYYLSQPWMHFVLALLILPVGFRAFYLGYREHKRALVFWLGVPGLLVVSITPYFFHVVLMSQQCHFPGVPMQFNRAQMLSETALMVSGSLLLISAHWFNRRQCQSCHHNHKAHPH